MLAFRRNWVYLTDVVAVYRGVLTAPFAIPNKKSIGSGLSSPIIYFNYLFSSFLARDNGIYCPVGPPTICLAEKLITSFKSYGSTHWVFTRSLIFSLRSPIVFSQLFENLSTPEFPCR